MCDGPLSLYMPRRKQNRPQTGSGGGIYFTEAESYGSAVMWEEGGERVWKGCKIAHINFISPSHRGKRHLSICCNQNTTTRAVRQRWHMTALDNNTSSCLRRGHLPHKKRKWLYGSTALRKSSFYIPLQHSSNTLPLNCRTFTSTEILKQSRNFMDKTCTVRRSYHCWDVKFRPKTCAI
jgi:hypothetical protein